MDSGLGLRPRATRVDQQKFSQRKNKWLQQLDLTGKTERMKYGEEKVVFIILT